MIKKESLGHRIDLRCMAWFCHLVPCRVPARQRKSWVTNYISIAQKSYWVCTIATTHNATSTDSETSPIRHTREFEKVLAYRRLQ